jgi:parvulin-like peptidyl-prolyl isomerase
MKRLLFFIALAITVAAGISAQIMDKPAATINYHESDIITVKQLEIAENRLRQQYSLAGQPAPSRTEILEELIINKLLLQAAKKENITVTESEVKSALRAQLGPTGVNVTDEQLKMLVRQQTGMAWVDYLKQGKEQLLVQNYIKAKKSYLIENVSKPSEQEIQEIYTENQHLFINPEMVRFSQIFRDTRNLNSTEKAKVKQLMEEVYRDLTGGRASFEDLVLKYSDDTNSRYKGGDMGYLARNDVQSKQLLGKDFFNTVFATEAGRTSGILESNIGFHIIKVTERRPAKILALNDPVTPATNETVKDRIVSLKMLEKQQILLQQAIEEIVQDLKRFADITIYGGNVEISAADLKYFESNVRS